MLNRIARIAVVAGAAGIALASSVGAANAAADGFFDSAGVDGCVAQRYLDHYNGSSHQYTYFVITSNGRSPISCSFEMYQNGNGATSSQNTQIYDGPGYFDQLCAYAFNANTNRTASNCDTRY